MMKTLLFAAATVLALAGVAPPPAPHATLAPLAPLARPGVSPTPNAAFEATHQRLVYGTIAAIHSKALIVVKLRSGYQQRVDTTDVMRTGHYSAPLFVGKLVAITGRLEPTGVLVATSISRTHKLPMPKEEPDRWLAPVPTPRP